MNVRNKSPEQIDKQ